MTTKPTFNYPFTNKDGAKFDRGDMVKIKSRNEVTRWKIHTISEGGMAYLRTAPVYMCGGYNTFGTDCHIDELEFLEHGKPL